jgi:hypothetical protein
MASSASRQQITLPEQFFAQTTVSGEVMFETLQICSRPNFQAGYPSDTSLTTVRIELSGLHTVDVRLCCKQLRLSLRRRL